MVEQEQYKHPIDARTIRALSCISKSRQGLPPPNGVLGVYGFDTEGKVFTHYSNVESTLADALKRASEERERHKMDVVVGVAMDMVQSLIQDRAIFIRDQFQFGLWYEETDAEICGWVTKELPNPRGQRHV